jgi:hypothetical protein
MSPKFAPFLGTMEGNGSYNRHAKLPAGGAAVALPLLERQSGASSSMRKIRLSSSPIMDHPKEKIRWSQCTWPFGECDTVLDRTAQSQ